MRYAISAIPRKGGRNTAQRVCIFVRQIKTEFESLTHYSRELGKKQHVTVQSLHKIEDGEYLNKDPFSFMLTCKRSGIRGCYTVLRIRSSK